jgi:hypothetical protein
MTAEQWLQSTVRYSTEEYGAVYYSTVLQCSIEQCGTVQSRSTPGVLLSPGLVCAWFLVWLQPDSPLDPGFHLLLLLLLQVCGAGPWWR